MTLLSDKNIVNKIKKFSVITVCYNAPNLERTCQSIVNQTYQDFEWIVVDGGSNQETLDIFEKYKYRINKFVSESDNGIYDAMNKGIKLSSGEYLLFMNGGDSFYDSNVLQAYVDNGLDKDIIYSNVELMGERNRIIEYPEILDTKFWLTNCICHQSTIVRKELFDKYGLYNEEYKIVADFQKWLEFIKLQNCSYKKVDFIGAKYSLDGISSDKKRRKFINEERELAIKKYFKEEEVRNVERIHYSLLERIFSIKNHPNMEDKIITILGIHIKAKRKNKD